MTTTNNNTLEFWSGSTRNASLEKAFVYDAPNLTNYLTVLLPWKNFDSIIPRNGSLTLTKPYESGNNYQFLWRIPELHSANCNDTKNFEFAFPYNATFTKTDIQNKSCYLKIFGDTKLIATYKEGRINATLVFNATQVIILYDTGIFGPLTNGLLIHYEGKFIGSQNDGGQNTSTTQVTSTSQYAITSHHTSGSSPNSYGMSWFIDSNNQLTLYPTTSDANQDVTCSPCISCMYKIHTDFYEPGDALDISFELYYSECQVSVTLTNCKNDNSMLTYLTEWYSIGDGSNGSLWREEFYSQEADLCVNFTSNSPSGTCVYDEEEGCYWSLGFKYELLDDTESETGLFVAGKSFSSSIAASNDGSCMYTIIPQRFGDDFYDGTLPIVHISSINYIGNSSIKVSSLFGFNGWLPDPSNDLFEVTQENSKDWDNVQVFGRLINILIPPGGVLNIIHESRDLQNTTLYDDVVFNDKKSGVVQTLGYPYQSEWQRFNQYISCAKGLANFQMKIVYADIPDRGYMRIFGDNKMVKEYRTNILHNETIEFNATHALIIFDPEKGRKLSTGVLLRYEGKFIG
uniref:Uncharacterized protein n=1 Tax=Acrobeloides nanus TaxID=290746 RepID=A0A914DW90_9BILA